MKYPNLRKSGSAYYYDHGGKPRRWEPLGNDEARAMVKYRRIRAQAVRYTNSGHPEFAITLRIMPNGVRCWRVKAKERKDDPAPPIKVAMPPAAGKAGSYVHDSDRGSKPVRTVKGSKY